MGLWAQRLQGPGFQDMLKETTSGFVYRASIKASIWYIDPLKGSYSDNYPPENVLEHGVWGMTSGSYQPPCCSTGASMLRIGAFGIYRRVIMTKPKTLKP